MTFKYFCILEIAGMHFKIVYGLELSKKRNCIVQIQAISTMTNLIKFNFIFELCTLTHYSQSPFIGLRASFSALHSYCLDKRCY